MKQYNDALELILENGDWQDNRTGIPCISFPGVTMRFDLKDGYPAVTTKKLAFQSVKGELAGFMKGVQSAALFRELKCKIWDQNANENEAWLKNPNRKGEDDLGPVYGAQWRRWPAFKMLTKEEASSAIGIGLANDGWEEVADDSYGSFDRHDRLVANTVIFHKEIDQIKYVVNEILHNPTNRRILFHGWNWAALDQMALPPCHLLYQFIPNTTKKELSLTLTIRSNDFFLGAPFNIASAALLLEIVAKLTGYKAKWLITTSNDAHVYENHLEQCKEQLSRTPLPLPKLKFADNFPTFESLSESFQGPALTGAIMGILDNLNPDDFTLEGYEHHPPIKAPMAV